MCSIMIADHNKMVRQWLVKRIKSSRIQGDLVMCEGVQDALQYLVNHDVDIVLTRIDKGAVGIDFTQEIKRRHLFTIVVGYGSCKDSVFLLKAMRNGISFYSSNIYDTKELVNVLNKVYDQYRRQQMELKLRLEEEKRHAEKYYNSGLLQEWSTDFYQNATKRNAQGVNQYIDYLCEVMDRQSFLSSKRMVIELLVILGGRLESEGMDLPVFPRSGEDYHLIISAGAVEELKAWFKKSMAAIARMAGEISTADTNAHKLTQAVSYIDSHYHKDISRDDVAAHVHLTPCYFSQFFKQQMGESFVEYLRRIRIERAKHLLEFTTEHTADISMKVGYNDSKYFSRVFKEHTGYTPCEYKRMVTSVQQCAL